MPTKEQPEKTGESPRRTWGQRIEDFLMGTGGSAPQVEFTPAERLEINTIEAKAKISQLAEALNQPTRLVINGRKFWFDAKGNQSDKENALRFEKKLNDPESPNLGIPEFEGSTLDTVQRVATIITQEINQPIKINRVWFTITGMKASPERAAEFEKSFGFKD